MFMNIDNHEPSSTAAIDENGRVLSYGDLSLAVSRMSAKLDNRTLVFAFCENSIGSMAGYVSFLSNRTVPLMLDRNIADEALAELIKTYRPQYLWAPDDALIPRNRPIYGEWGYSLLETGCEPVPMHHELALLVTTSGSTGSPKLVRQSYRNIESNTKSIVEYLGINAAERPITTLPMNYVFGMSVINSHLSEGATILLTEKTLMQKQFWQFLKEHGATSIAGVPYTYEMLNKLRFTRMDLPSLGTMTQAGGKLNPELHRVFAGYAEERNIKFVVMYGAAEATARMGYLPPERSLEKWGSMGIAIPGGRFELISDDGCIIESSGTTGELVYYGDNVTLGYAESSADLLKGDERGGRLETGDIAVRDPDGYYSIVGRKKRFLKIYGNRVNLDEMERLLKNRFDGAECVCCGTDDRMLILVTDSSLAGPVREFAARYTKLNSQAFAVKTIDAIPRNEAGKTLYSKLEEHYE